jgi:hypothetical protein
MKKIAIAMLVLIFGLWGCTKDSMPDPSNPDDGNSLALKYANASKVSTYELKGTLLNTPLPAIEPYMAVYAVSGHCTHLGLIDEKKSRLYVTGLLADPQVTYPLVNMGLLIILYTQDGSTLLFNGSAALNQLTGYSESVFTIDSGTRRFEGAKGWFKSTSQKDVNGVNHVSGYGEMKITKK